MPVSNGIKISVRFSGTTGYGWYSEAVGIGSVSAGCFAAGNAQVPCNPPERRHIASASQVIAILGVTLILMAFVPVPFPPCQRSWGLFLQRSSREPSEAQGEVAHLSRPVRLREEVVS